MSTSHTTQYTDEEYLTEILQLVRGTHWTKQELETFCMIPLSPGEEVDPDELFQGYKVNPKYAYDTYLGEVGELEDAMDWIRWEYRFFPAGLRYVEAEQTYDDEHEKTLSELLLSGVLIEDRAWKKAQMCLIGMVLKVGQLHMDEDQIVAVRVAISEATAQSRRIVERLFKALPEEQDYAHVGRAPWKKSNPEEFEHYSEFDHIAVKIQNIESWNDLHTTTKELVEDVLIKAGAIDQEA